MKTALAQVREDQGLSQAALGEKAGVHMRTIRRIETDPDYSPTVDTMVALADALGVGLERLVLPDNGDASGNGAP